MTRTKMVPIPWSCEEWCLHWREHCTVTAITSLKREHSKKRKTESIPRWGRGLTFLQAWFLTFPNCNQHSKTLRKQIYSSSPNNPAFLPMLLSSATSTLSPLVLPHSCRLLLEESLNEETICVRTWNKELVGNHPALLKYKAWRGMFGFIQHFNQIFHMNFTKGRVHTLHVAELWRKRYFISISAPKGTVLLGRYTQQGGSRAAPWEQGTLRDAKSGDLTAKRSAQHTFTCLTSHSLDFGYHQMQHRGDFWYKLVGPSLCCSVSHC